MIFSASLNSQHAVLNKVFISFSDTAIYLLQCDTCVIVYISLSTYLSYLDTLQSRPHELVYAKVTGYPYWPAKVMEMKPDGCDVRFFGPGHHRYIVSDNNISSFAHVLFYINVVLLMYVLIKISLVTMEQLSVENIRH